MAATEPRTTVSRCRDWLRLLWRQWARPWLDRNYWAVVGIMWALALGLGYWGWVKHFRELGEPRTLWDLLYLTLQLFTVESGSVFQAVPWQLDIARFLAPATTLYTALAALTLIFRDQLQMVRVRLLREHVVICGLGRRGLLLAQAFRARNVPVVVIEHDTGNDRITPCREHGAIVLYGDASDQEVLRGAGVHRASSIIAVCGEDGTNAEIAVDCRDLVAHRRGEPLKCVAQIEDPELCHLLKDLEFTMAEADSFRLEFFNSHIRGAKLVIEEHPPFERSTPGIAHLLIIGIGRMGENVAVHAAKLWRNQGLSETGRLRITLIDRIATDKRKLILLKNPLLADVCDLSACDLDVHSSEFFAGAFLYDNRGERDVTIVYVCLDNDAKALAAALALLKHLRGRHVPIVVRTTREGGLSTLFQGTEEARQTLGALHAFGLLEKTCKPELVLGGTHEILAKAMYEEHADRGCLGHSGPAAAVSGSWQSLSDGHQDMYRRRADRVGEMIRAVGCNLETLGQWDAEVFAFTAEEETALAKRLHDCVLEELRQGNVPIPPGFGGMQPDPDLTPVRWERRSDRVKEAYKAEIRRLPGFLARVDLQVYRQ
jgi:hypothetical protein